MKKLATLVALAILAACLADPMPTPGEDDDFDRSNAVDAGFATGAQADGGPDAGEADAGEADAGEADPGT